MILFFLFFVFDFVLFVFVFVFVFVFECAVAQGPTLDPNPWVLGVLGSLFNRRHRANLCVIDPMRRMFLRY